MSRSVLTASTATARLTRLFGLHGQVALVALVLLVIPWVGYSYVKAMEKLLRENQEQQVMGAARSIATALQDRPKLLELHGTSRKITWKEVCGLFAFDSPALPRKRNSDAEIEQV